MILLRLRSTKKGKIRFASHRDIAKVWERSFRRANIPLIYSEGFSPRPRIAFGLALPTGAESECEYLDVKVDEQNLASSQLLEIPEALTELLPEGIQVTGMAEIDNKAISLQQAVTSCLWEITIAESKHDADNWVREVTASKELVVERVRKGKIISDDIRPFIKRTDECGVNDEGHVTLKVELRTQPRSLRPSEFLKSKRPHLTQLRLRRLTQFIDTGDMRLDPLEVGQSLDTSMELCSP
ncbi:MAG: TIGR03936 family radical SAM-associated protein [Acidimicrobiales bacterium]|nr:TIGR03936 family radical SAM-associated protein [Acidimicrobiales bacterium]MDP6298954.1 TIGR03936 family radical SAM-associated protein [Acidimicrobiales bacterium]HJM27813.1 TIGR03936 family radical SAM-associated protein [Acidimicrobiales bacterium]